MPSFESLFALEGCWIETVQITDTGVTVYAAAASAAAICPLCGTESTCVRSRYTRTLRDLPCAGRRVQIILRVRRFRCQNSACSRTIFAERFATLAPPHVQRTVRLRDEQQALGLALGGEAAARQSRKLHMPASPATLLRLVRQLPPPKRPTPTVLGVDDWSLRKGKTFGTLLVDLERHQPVDLLPERSGELVAHWLKTHPGVEVITRDRSTTYADGARQGAPDAIQVADRFHLVQNWGDVLEQLLNRHRSHLSTTVAATVAAAAEEAPALAIERPAAEAGRDRRRAERLERYETIRALYKKGMHISEIARKLEIDWKTARKYAKADVFPDKPMGAPRRGSILTPYEAYLYARFQEGCHDGVRLWQEIREQGYGGSRSLVAMYVAQLRREARMQRVLARFPVAADQTELSAAEERQSLSPREVRYLFLRRPAKRTDEQTTLIDELAARHADLADAAALSERFLRLVRERQGEAVFESWMQDALASPNQEIRQFAAHLRQDEAAVRAGVTLKWSNGQTEGQVNRLKLIKRSMYGRAKFDLLRQRVLAVA